MRRAPPPRPAAFRERAAAVALVALGSAVGGTLRALVSLAAPAGAGLYWTGLPWATLAVNVAGSFAIALYLGLKGPEAPRPASPRQRHFVAAGLCGGFTTFSLFSLETLRLIQFGQPEKAALVAALSLAAWLAAAWAGHALALRLNRLQRR